MSSYSTYNNRVSRKLGTSSEDFWTAAMRCEAINDAIDEFLNQYDLAREMIKRSTIAFSATGIASIPSDYFKMVKLWDVDSDSIEENQYTYITPDEYDKRDSTDGYYWTEDYDTSSAAIVLKCLPIDAGTLQIRYIKEYTNVVTTASTDSGLSSKWDEIIAVSATIRLLEASGEDVETAKADKLRMTKQSLISSAIQAVQNAGGWKAAPRFKSVWNRISLLNR